MSVQWSWLTVMMIVVSVECFAQLIWVVVVKRRLAAAISRLCSLRCRLSKRDGLEREACFWNSSEMIVRADFGVVVFRSSIASVWRVRNWLGSHVARRAIRRRAVACSACVSPGRTFFSRRAGVRWFLVLLAVLSLLHENAHADDNNNEYRSGNRTADKFFSRGWIGGGFCGVGFFWKRRFYREKVGWVAWKSVENRAGVWTVGADAELVLSWWLQIFVSKVKELLLSCLLHIICTCYCMSICCCNEL